MSHTCLPRSRNRGTGVRILARDRTLVLLVWSFKNRDNSTFSTGHGIQHTSQKAGCPKKLDCWQRFVWVMTYTILKELGD